MAIPENYKPTAKFVEAGVAYTAYADIGWSIDQMVAEGYIELSALATPVTDVSELVAAYVILRDAKTALNRETKEKVSDLDESMKVIEDDLHKFLKSTGQESAKTAAGTFFTKTNRMVGNEDRPKFMEFVSGLLLTSMNDLGAVNAERYVGEQGDANWAADMKILAADDAFAFFGAALPKTVITEYMDEHADTPPPGVSHTTQTVIQIRK